MTNKADDIKEAAGEALKTKKTMESYIEALSGESRRDRQKAGAVIAVAAKEDPTKVVPYISEIIDALDRPEAQTRWEALDALTALVSEDSRACERALVGAETALFDEDSGPLRLSSMQFLCKFGGTTENRSEKVWPLIDEAIQCYHGDLEFQDMLLALIDFSSNKLAPQVKEEFAARMKFDAENGKGGLKKRASQIEENLANQ